MKLLEQEKQNMGAAGKRREDELLQEIATLRKELAEKAKKIDSLHTTIEEREKQSKIEILQLKNYTNKLKP